MTTKLRFQDFVESGASNAWVYETRPGVQGTLALYVRRSVPRVSAHTDYDLANLHATVRGQGLLTTFLDRYEPLYLFYIENIVNPRLYDYLRRRGYVDVRTPWSDSMVLGWVARATREQAREAVV